MSRTVDRLLEAALKRAPDEGTRIVAELLATLGPDLPGRRHCDEEWIREIEWRRARPSQGLAAHSGPTRKSRSGAGSPPR